MRSGEDDEERSTEREEYMRGINEKRGRYIIRTFIDQGKNARAANMTSGQEDDGRATKRGTHERKRREE